MLPPRSKGRVVVPITPSSATARSARYGTSMSTISWSQKGAGAGTVGGFGGVPGPGLTPPTQEVLSGLREPDGPGVTNETDFETTPGPLPGDTDRNVLA